MTVTDAEGTDAPEAGESAWAVEIDGYALFLKPDDSPDGNFIAMVDAGSCPSDDFLGNWVVVKTRVGADATDPEQDYFGSFLYTAADSSAQLPGRYAISDQFPSLGVNNDIGTGSCVDGIMEVDDDAMYLTANGGALVHTNQSDEDEANIIFAMPQQSLTAMDTLDGEYVGLLFDQSPSNEAFVQPVLATCSAGICSAGLYDTIESTTAHTDFTVNLTGTMDMPEPGFITGTITADNEVGIIACLVNTDLGTDAMTLMSCVGQAPGNPSQMFNLILRG
jgi:hypothetical protein